MKLKTRNLCSVRRLTIAFLVLSFYFVLKFLYLMTEAELDASRSAREDAYSSTVGADMSAPTSHVTAPSTSMKPDCSSKYLDTPLPYVTANCSDNACKRLTCRNLIYGHDPALYNYAREFMAKHPVVLPSDHDLINQTVDCGRFRRLRGYHDKASPDSADMPIAFSLLVHTSSAQVERLLRSIYRPQNLYCIHVDLKAPSSIHAAMTSLARCFDNVFIASKSERIVYAGFSRLQADINCMRDLDDHAMGWKYLLNIAAQSFPLQTPEEMASILRIYNGSNDIEGIYGRRILRHRFELEWMEHVDTNSVNQTGRRNPPPPDNLDVVRGSAYGVFSRAFVRFALTNKMALDLLEWSRRTFSPDEHYWATLNHMYTNPHLRTPGGYSGPPNSKPWMAVFVKWGLPSKCTGTFVRGVCIFGVEDLCDLVPRHEFFANKFYADYQPLALDCLEAWIAHKVACPTKFDREYYAALPFVASQKWYL